MSNIVSSGAQSAELSQQLFTRVPKDSIILCLRDQIIVEPLPHTPSDLIEVVEEMKPLRGIVKAVGPGHYPKRYDHPDKHRRTKMWDSKHFQPTEVKVGDVVELGSPQGLRGYSFQQIMWGDTMHLVCREADVSGVVCEG